MNDLIRLHIQSLHQETLYDLDALARLSGVQVPLLSHYIRLGLVDPIEGRGEGGMWFDDKALFVLRKIQRLRNELGVNLNGIGVVLELLEEIEELNRELARARADQRD